LKRLWPLSSVAAALALGILASPLLQAEETRTFVVTASRVAEEALDAPAQVTVVTAADIAEAGASNVVEALAATAGIEFRSYSSAAQAEISMRGFGENSHGRVLVLMDGRRLNNPDMQTINWLAVPLADVERIEVLQGGGSARYGNNAVGGVVNIITKKAQKGTSANGSLSVGSFGENRQQFSVNSGGDKGGFVATAEHYSTAGARERSGYRSANMSLRGFLDAGDELTLTAGTSLSDVFYEMPGYLTKSQFQADPAKAGNYEDEARERTYLAELGAEWTPSETLSIDVPLSYSFKDIKAEMPSYYNPGWGTPEQHSDRLAHNLQASPTLSWNGSIASMGVRAVIGSDLALALLDVAAYEERARTTKSHAFDISQFTIGPHLNLRVSPTERLSVEGSIRYDRSEISAENVDGSVDASKIHQAIVYDAGITFRPVGDAKAYARYGTVFRYPFSDEQTSLYGFGMDTFLTDLEAEKGFNAEAGASFAVGKTVSIDICAYWMELTDEIAYNSATYRNENLDQTRRIGADASFKFKPISFLSVKGSYGYVDAVFAGGANEGKRIPLVSAHKANVELSVAAPFGLNVSPSVSFRGDAYQGGDNANAGEKIDAYAIYSLALRFTPKAFGGALSFTGKAANLLDHSYAPYVYYGGYYPAAGRSFSLGASYRF